MFATKNKINRLFIKFRLNYCEMGDRRRGIIMTLTNCRKNVVSSRRLENCQARICHILLVLDLNTHVLSTSDI